MLSLILQTLGLSTDRNDSCIASEIPQGSASREGPYSKHDISKDSEGSPGQKPQDLLSPINERIFEAYWEEQIIPEFRCQALTKLFSTFLRSSREINLFFDNFWMRELPTKETDPSYQQPISLKEIRGRINRSIYGDSLMGFISDVESCFVNATSNNEVSDQIRQAAQKLLSVFRGKIRDFKTSQIETATKSFSRSSSKPDSMVAALIEKNNADQLRKALLPSSATLLVVPAVLVDHWMVSTHRIHRHFLNFEKDPNLYSHPVSLSPLLSSGTIQVEYRSLLLYKEDPSRV